MTEKELESLFTMIKFFLSKDKSYWAKHPEEVYSIYMDLQNLTSNAG